MNIGVSKKKLSQFIFAVLSPSKYFATKVNKAFKKKLKKLLWELSPRDMKYEIDIEEIKGYYLKL